MLSEHGYTRVAHTKTYFITPSASSVDKSREGKSSFKIDKYKGGLKYEELKAKLSSLNHLF